MSKLYLVGVTEDRSGLVLARSPRAKKGDSVLEIDHSVLDALAEIRRYRAEGATVPRVKSAALPSRRTTAGEVNKASALSPREMQSRLRRGESIASVARRAGVDEWRVEVYAAPITAEQVRVVSRARQATMHKRGAGPSGRPLGEAVQANIVEKRVSINADEFEAGWSAYEPEPDRWVVRFEYVSRGHRQRAEWIYEDDDGSVVATNRVATILGWRDPRRAGRLPPLPDAPRAPAKKKPPARKPAAKKPAATKPAPAKKKPPARKPAAKKSSGKKPAPKKARVRKPAVKKPAPTKAPAKKPPASARKIGTPGKTSAAATRRASPPRHLRVLEPPPGELAPAGRAESGDWRTLAPRRESDPAAPYARRSWREEVGVARSDDAKLEPPDWIRTPERTARPAKGEAEVDREMDEPEAPPVSEPPVIRSRPVTSRVSVDATPVSGRRRPLRRRERPLRGR